MPTQLPFGVDWLEVSTVVIAVATVLYCVFSGWMAYEMRSVRIEQRRPHVVLYPRRRQDDWNQLELVIQNVGGGTAYDVKFDMSDQFLVRGWTKQGGGLLKMESGPIASGIPAMTPGRTEVVWWGVHRLLWQSLRGKTGTVTASFAAMPGGRRCSVELPLSVDEIDTETTIGDSVVTELKEISQSLKRVTRDGIYVKRHGRYKSPVETEITGI